MAVTRSLIIQNVVIANSNGASQTTYEFPITTDALITIASTTDTVGAGRTLTAFHDVTVTVPLLNTNVFNDQFGRVYGANTAAEPVEARMILRGVSGSFNVNAGPSIISAAPNYEGNRKTYVLTLTERVTNVEAFLTETTV